MIRYTLTHSETDSLRILLKSVLPIRKLLVRLRITYDIIGVIAARDEFKDLDVVFPWNAPYLIKRQHHHTVRPFYIRHNDEEIRVTLERIDTHFKREYPYFLGLQRYIVGRPNLLKLPIYPVQEDKSLHW